LADAEICRLSLADSEKLVTFAIDCMVLIAKITIEVLIAKSLQKKSSHVPYWGMAIFFL
jgi:hypothetical protein